MSFTRRQFLTSVAATTLFIPMSGLAKIGEPAPRRSTRYLSARASTDGRYFLSGFESDGSVRFDVALPGRGHGVALHPNQPQVAAVARRPGQFLLVIDSDNGKVLHDLRSEDGRHFYGHGVYSADGRWLYTTENDIETGRGIIGVRDTQKAYAKVREFSSHGTGPHELRLLADGHTLVIANGGIDTRPETGRAMRNLDSMSPSLVYVDAASGRLLEEHKLAPELHQNSIRHFAINAEDQVCFAMQHQGDPNDLPPLIGLHRRGGEIQLLQAPEAIQKQMTNYCGSVCADPSGQWFAVSSPKGNLVTFWSAVDGKFAGKVEIADGCGIAAGGAAGEYLLSSGMGDVYRYQLAGGKLQPIELNQQLHARWDNHMAQIRL